MALCLWLAVPFAGAAFAAHEGTLDIAEETDSNPVGTTHTLTANVAFTAANGTTVEVDFEIDCLTDCADADYAVTGGGGSPAGGPTSATEEPGVDGNQTPGTSDDTRTTPELSCTVTINANAGSCTVDYIRNDAGDDEVIGWIDHDDSNATDESDQTEAQATTGGDTEPDDTDVVSKNWFGGLGTDVVLDCDDVDETAGTDGDLDQDDPDTGDSEEDTNLPGVAETYNCLVWNDNGASGGTAGDGIMNGGEAPSSGVRIDAENLNGSNDPDNSAAAGTADYNDACTTGADGRCTYTLNASENQLGNAEVCFWTDEDNDNVFDPAGAPNDGGDCAEGVFADQGDNTTDKVSKTWAQRAADALDLEPEFDSNVAGTSHTVTATVIDQFGDPIANVPVDFSIDGRNEGAAGEGPAADGTGVIECDNVPTNSSGVATCTYTDEGTTSDAIAANAHEDDIIDACVDAGAQAGLSCDEAADTDTNESENNDLTDQVEKFWFATVPTAGAVLLDADATVEAGFGDPCGDNDADGSGGTDPGFDQTAENSAGEVHAMCVEVRTSGGTPIPGKSVTVDLSGVGEITDAADFDEFWNGGDGEDTCEGDGTDTTTVTTNASGEAFFYICSEESGETDVTATSDGASDTGTKTWTAELVRILDCSPEEANNTLNTQHTVTCTAVDRFGNPVTGVETVAVEDGVGEMTAGGTTATETYYGTNRTVRRSVTDSAGQVTVTTTSAAEGTQTIEVALAGDAGDGTNGRNGAPQDTDSDSEGECDSRATEDFPGDGVNTAPGTTAGACFDTVTKTWSTEPPPPPVLTTGKCSGFSPDSRTPRSSGGFVIVGTSGADVLDGSGGEDLICGLGGDDVIAGRGAGDLISGGGDNDTISGGGGKDNIAGNGGNDSVSGNRGNDAIKGNSGNDTLKGNGGIDSLSGGKGADSLQGGDGDDILKGGPGNDTLRGGDGSDLLDGGDGNDGCFGNAGNDKVKNCE